MLDATRLRARLADTGLSQAKLAQRVGVSQQTIGRLVSGDTYGSKYLHLIARELRTSAAYLTGETDDPESNVPDSPLLDREDLELIDMIQSLEPKVRAALVQIVRSLTGASEAPTLHAPQHEFRSRAA